MINSPARRSSVLEAVLNGAHRSYVNFAPVFTPPAGRIGASLLVNYTPYSKRKLYAISRLKARVNAWYWSVHLRRRGVRYHKSFFDGKYGGAAEARAAAVAWRDSMCAKLGETSLREFLAKKRSSNRSGMSGVRFSRPPGRPDGRWEAILKRTGRGATVKSFSVRKYGEKQAFDRAVAARIAMLDTLAYGLHPSYSRAAKRLAS